MHARSCAASGRKELEGRGNFLAVRIDRHGTPVDECFLPSGRCKLEQRLSRRDARPKIPVLSEHELEAGVPLARTRTLTENEELLDAAVPLNDPFRQVVVSIDDARFFRFRSHGSDRGSFVVADRDRRFVQSSESGDRETPSPPSGPGPSPLDAEALLREMRAERIVVRMENDPVLLCRSPLVGTESSRSIRPGGGHDRDHEREGDHCSAEKRPAAVSGVRMIARRSRDGGRRSMQRAARSAPLTADT